MGAINSQSVYQETLPNGLAVITEPMAYVRSVAVGLWLRSGSRREPAPLNGISHFTEHMVFKGTERRTAEEIAREVDRVGGMLDAFTAKETVCFQTRVLDEHLPHAFDVLADLVLRPRFAEEEIEREKSVILEEIRMTQDNPEDLVHEVFTQNFWRSHPLGRPILGTPESVSSFDRAALQQWFRRSYAPNNLMITAAGNVSHAQLVELAAAQFADLPPAEQAPAERPPKLEAALTTCHKSELEQAHICIGVPSYPMAHRRRFAASILNNLLGGGMSSRLFQNIREKQGLAYAISSDLNPYRDTGLLSVYAGTASETAERLIASVMAEFRNLKEQAVSPEELRRAQDHLKGALLLSLESTGARMSHLARQFLYFGRFFSPEELIAELESVTREETQEVAQEFFQAGQAAAAVVGNLDGFKLTHDQLVC